MSKHTKINPLKKIISPVLYNQGTFLLFLLWELLYYFIYEDSFRVDPSLMQYKIANLLYNDSLILIISAFMLFRALAVCEEKHEKALRILCIFLMSIYAFAYFDTFGCLYRRSNILVFVLLLSITRFDINLFMPVFFVFQTIIGFLRISLSLLGKGTDYGWVFTKILEQNYGHAGIALEARYRFGYYHPNDFHLVFMVYLATLLYLVRKTKYRYVVVGIGAALNIFFYKFTISRSGFLGITMLLIFYIIYPFIFKSINNVLSYILEFVIQLIPIIATTITIILATQSFNEQSTEESLLKSLNRILTGRIHWLQEAYKNVPPTFLGSSLKKIIVDASYLKLLLYAGIIAFVVYFILHIILVHWAYKKQEYALLGVISAFDIYFIINGEIINFFGNFLLYMVAIAIADNSKTLHNKKNN